MRRVCARGSFIGDRWFGELGERLLEHLSRLGAEDEQTTIEREGRDARDADRLRLGGRSTNAVGVRVAGQHLVHVRGIEPRLDGERPQLSRVADVPAFFPVGVHQPVVHGVDGARVPARAR